MYKILIVEDDETISLVMENKLKQWDYDTFRVSDFKHLDSVTTFKPTLYYWI